MQRLERHLDRRRRRREQKKHKFLELFEEYQKRGGGYAPKTKAFKENSNQLPTWNARKHGGRFYLNFKRLKAVLLSSGYPGGCPTPSRPRCHFFFGGGLKFWPSILSSFPTVSGNETRMARDFAPEFSFNVHMDEDHFPDGLCMLHFQKAQQAEQRQLAAAMKSLKNSNASAFCTGFQSLETMSRIL